MSGVERHHVPILGRYFDSRFGQLHVRLAKPSGGASLDRPPVVFLHPGPQSSRYFTGILPELGRDRQVFAPDYPGCGESSPPSGPIPLEDYAEILATWFDQLGFGEIDIVGHHTGSVIGTELAHQRPKTVRRMVLIGLPIVTPEEVEELFKSAAGKPWPPVPRLDGSHILDEWQRSIYWQGSDTPLEILTRGFVDKLSNGERVGWSARAALNYPFAERLAALTQPILGIGPKDDLWERSPRAESLIRNGSFERWPDNGFNIFDAAPGRIGAVIRRHLDG